ncbi:MAG: hypothetical protein ACE366_24640 [Bradymonadia bacterium]
MSLKTPRVLGDAAFTTSEATRGNTGDVFFHMTLTPKGQLWGISPRGLTRFNKKGAAKTFEVCSDGVESGSFSADGGYVAGMCRGGDYWVKTLKSVKKSPERSLWADGDFNLHVWSGTGHDVLLHDSSENVWFRWRVGKDKRPQRISAQLETDPLPAGAGWWVQADGKPTLMGVKGATRTTASLNCEPHHITRDQQHAVCEVDGTQQLHVLKTGEQVGKIEGALIAELDLGLLVRKSDDGYRGHLWPAPKDAEPIIIGEMPQVFAGSGNTLLVARGSSAGIFDVKAQVWKTPSRLLGPITSVALTHDGTVVAATNGARVHAFGLKGAPKHLHHGFTAASWSYTTLYAEGDTHNVVATHSHTGGALRFGPGGTRLDTGALAQGEGQLYLAGGVPYLYQYSKAWTDLSGAQKIDLPKLGNNHIPESGVPVVWHFEPPSSDFGNPPSTIAAVDLAASKVLGPYTTTDKIVAATLTKDGPLIITHAGNGLNRWRPPAEPERLLEFDPDRGLRRPMRFAKWQLRGVLAQEGRVLVFLQYVDGDTQRLTAISTADGKVIAKAEVSGEGSIPPVVSANGRMAALGLTNGQVLTLPLPEVK